MRGKLANVGQVLVAVAPSMRPAHCAREVSTRRRPSCTSAPTFNEARALCAGSWSRRRCRTGAANPFNEARALCAGSWAWCSKSSDSPLAFNEARALCAGSCRASAGSRPAPSFNEARALCAGSWPVAAISTSIWLCPSMRPAHCAREVVESNSVLDIGRAPSMRPAHCAREVVNLQSWNGMEIQSFNEARALCAGSSLQTLTS